VILNEKEQKVLRAIAKWYREGKNSIDRETAMAELEISDSEYNTIMLLMEENGVIEAMNGHPSDGPDYIALDFTPLCRSEQLVRQMDIEIENKKNTPLPDFVDQLKKRIRQNPVAAWLIIIFIVLTSIITLVNQLWDLIMKFVK
jgi:hypothetical protein